MLITHSDDSDVFFQSGFAYSVVLLKIFECHIFHVQGGPNMTGTDLYVNKPHCAAAVRP